MVQSSQGKDCTCACHREKPETGDEQMIRIGDWILGGKNSEFHSAAVFGLSNKNTPSFEGSYEGWKFAISDGLFMVQSEKTFSDSDLFREAHEICEKILDMISVKLLEYDMLEDSKGHYLLFYVRGDREVLFCRDTVNFPMTVTSEIRTIPENNTTEISMEISLEDRFKTEKDEIKFSDGQWKLIYRYYRFAVMSTNLYDAYRWMYLVFEQIMQLLVPIRKNAKGRLAEREGEWLKRALFETSKKYPIFQEEDNRNEESVREHVEKFMEEQYKDTRCRLFHSKDRIAVLNEELEQQIFQIRYDELKGICGTLMRSLSFLENPYGIVTYAGFRSLILHGWEGQKGYLCAAAPEELQDKDGHGLTEAQTVAFTDNIQGYEAAPGLAALKFTVDIVSDKEAQYISYGLEMDNKPLTIGEFFKPITCSGNCRLIIEQAFRLINKGEFGKY